MFKIGDKIVYPMHGAGIIETVEEHEVLGEERSYFVIKMPIGNMKIMMPTDSTEDLGIRPVISKSEVHNVIEELSSGDLQQNKNWNKRYRENLTRIKSGDIYEIANVYKNLAKRDIDKGLSTGERKMFSNARQILFSELIIAGSYTVEEVEAAVNKAISKNIDSCQEEQEVQE